VSYRKFEGSLFNHEEGQLRGPSWSGERIYLGFHNQKSGPRRCSLTGKDFELRERIGFFVDSELDRPVAYSEALTKGFTMTAKDFQRLEEKLELLQTLKGVDLRNKRALKANKENP